MIWWVVLLNFLNGDSQKFDTEVREEESLYGLPKTSQQNRLDSPILVRNTSYPDSMNLNL